MAKISDKQQLLVDKLKELFMMDQADLNFGIYRVMNAKHDEIESFLHNDLLSTIHTVLQGDGKESDVQKELNEAIKNAQSLGVDPDAIPKVQELKELLGGGAGNSLEKDENEIFSQLTTFFSRYYDGGDFMSLRRYKKETYSPLAMNGEEVKLHWANADQYYIKSAENFSHYAFKIGEQENQKHICFELVDASTEQNNVKATEDKERRFILNESNPIALKQTDDGEELLINFSYQADAKKRSQKELNQASIKFIIELEASGALLVDVDDWVTWQSALLTLAPTDKNKKRTILEKHLNDYTAKNSFDYFIHKDLGGFMRRELDFFIKNELLLLDDIVPSTVDTIDKQLLSNERSLKKVIAFKVIAQKLIALLAQLEDFQKKLWLKKKFVLETNYCMTLDRVSESFYAEIVANEKQVKEWQALGFIESDAKLSEDYLKENPYLLIDTGLFESEFKQQLLAEIDDLDEATDGLLVQSESFQALNLLQGAYRGKVNCIYLDPPYNTGDDGFVYKDAYKSSTWASMYAQSLPLSRTMLDDLGSLFSSCDEHQFLELGFILRSVYGEHNHVETITWNKRIPKNDKGIGNIHEYIYLFSLNDSDRRKNDLAYLMRKDGLDEVYEVVKKCKRGGIELSESQRELKKFYKKNNYDRGITLYCELDPMYKIWGKINMSWPNAKTQGPRYEVISPVTGKAVPIPDNGWRWKEETFREAENDGGTYKLPDGSMMVGRIWYSTKETVQPSSVKYLKEVESFLLRSIISHKSDGSIHLDNLGLYGLFDYPKPPRLIEWLFYSSGVHSGVFLDYFGGSGTTAHAIINLNREDSGSRKYFLIEMGVSLDTAIKPRIKKVAYSERWKDGEPVADKHGNFNGISHCFKTIRLESYEDVMDNLKLQRSDQQSDALAKSENKELKEDYLLHYMLDVEAKESLLPANLFIDPFNATMRVVRNNEARKQSIDLVETFNYLLGLRIKTMRQSKGIVEVTGLNPNDQMVLILWRNTNDIDNDTLDDWFKKQSYNSRDMEFDLIYVNGDNNLPNLRQGEETWKVQLIDEAFQTVMFDVKDV